MTNLVLIVIKKNELHVSVNIESIKKNNPISKGYIF